MYRDVQVPREAGEGEDAERPRDWPGPSRERPGAKVLQRNHLVRHVSGQGFTEIGETVCR